MLLIVVYYRRCGRNLRAKLYNAINSLSANHAYLKTLYTRLLWHYMAESLSNQCLQSYLQQKKVIYYTNIDYCNGQWCNLSAS